MKRIVAILALASVLVLAGCGSSSGGSDATGTTKPADAGGTTAPGDGGDAGGSGDTGGSTDLIDACKLLSIPEASKAAEAEVTDTVPATAGTTSSCGYGAASAGGAPVVLLYVYPPKDSAIDGDPIAGLGANSGVTPLFATYHGKKHNYQVGATGADDAEREARSVAALKVILANAGEK